MRHTLKASFDQRSDAEHLLNELHAAGHTAATLALTGATHSGPYTRQRHAVTLLAASDQEAQSALAIIERHIPARTEDIAYESEPDPAPAAVSAARTYPPGTGPGALQFRPLGDSPYFGTQNAEAPPAGNTFKETMGTATQWTGADEYTIARHGPAPHADAAASGMDDSEARRSETYRSHGRDGVDEDMARAARHAGELSAWGKFEDAIHHGWHRISTAMDDASHEPGSGPSAWHKMKEAVRHGWDRVRS